MNFNFCVYLVGFCMHSHNYKCLNYTLITYISHLLDILYTTIVKLIFRLMYSIYDILPDGSLEKYLNLP